MTFLSALLAAEPAERAVGRRVGHRRAGADPDAWYPEKGGSEDSPWAKRICMACEVRTECLDAALERAEQWGIWGGMTRHERRAERRRRGMAPPRPDLGEVSDDGGEAA